MSLLVLFHGNATVLSAPAATITTAAPAPTEHTTYHPSAGVINTNAPAPTLISTDVFMAPAALINTAAPVPGLRGVIPVGAATIATAAPVPSTETIYSAPPGIINTAAPVPVLFAPQLFFPPSAGINLAAPRPDLLSNTPRAAFYVIRTNNHAESDEFEFESFSELNFSRTLDAAGELTVRINLRDESITEEKFYPGKRDIFVYRNNYLYNTNELVWAGPIWEYEYEGDNTLTLHAADWYSMLDRRFIRPGDEKLDFPGVVDVYEIVRALIDYAQSRDDIGITFELPDALRDYAWRDREFWWYDLASISDIIQQLADIPNAWDFYVTPDKQWVMRQRRGADNDAVTFSKGVNLETPVGFSKSAENTMNYLIYAGAGEGKDTVVGIAEDVAFQLEYRLLEGTHQRQSRKTTVVQDGADRQIQRKKYTATQPTIKFRAIDLGAFSELALAENFEIDYEDGMLALNDRYRLASYAVELTTAGREDVTLTFDALFSELEEDLPGEPGGGDTGGSTGGGEPPGDGGDTGDDGLPHDGTGITGDSLVDLTDRSITL